MSEKIIGLESFLTGESKRAFLRLMEMTPKKDRNDTDLQRLVAFRLKTDGEEPTRQYLRKKLEIARRCEYEGDFFAFLKSDMEEKKCGFTSSIFPDEAG